MLRNSIACLQSINSAGSLDLILQQDKYCNTLRFLDAVRNEATVVMFCGYHREADITDVNLCCTPPLFLTLQMWNSLFWPCFAAVPKCVNKQQDDIGFISSLLTNMQQLLLPGIPLKPKALLTGYSNGGMLAQALLCKQPSLAGRLAGVGILASVLGEEFAGNSCKRQLPAALPLLWMHGTADDTLPYGRGMSEGIQMLGAGERSGQV
jgi:hypothetical protein